MGEWFELDLTVEERKRMEVAALKESMSPEVWMSRHIRLDVGLSERLGARLPNIDEKTVDIREDL